MEETFPHLPLTREEPVNDKRPRASITKPPPADIRGHGRGLQQSLDIAKEAADLVQGGFDSRRLFSFSVDKGFSPDDLRKIVSPDYRDGIELVSQESEEIVVAFVSEVALESFEALLATLAGGGVPPNKQVFYALQGMDSWNDEDRKGWALKNLGIPDTDTFLLDIELWPLEDNPRERQSLWDSFEDWLDRNEITRIDSVKQAGITLYRVRCASGQIEILLNHRDVRMVDLPPKFGLDIKTRLVDIEEMNDVLPPPEDAPSITILDSGLATGHPLLETAIGDAESFLDDKEPSDENGHGTMVGGLALYGDVEKRFNERRFVPELRLFSGRILDENAENETGFVENQIDEAVRYFIEAYDCRVFVLSFGDQNKPYVGGHIRDLAFTLDSLSRELQVLFVVSAGNVSASKLVGLEWREQYPDYLLEEAWSIIDPAPAINALTVGSLARHDQTTNSQRYSNDPAEVPIAGVNQPSPFTRHGPTVGGAIKPDLVAYGGNWAINTRALNMLVPNSGLGELSINMDFSANGGLFVDDSGTSFAAPYIAHLASMLKYELADVSINLMRALLVVHAKIPVETNDLFNSDVEKCRKVCGFGKVDTAGLMRSLENEVTLITDGSISNKKHHFYEVPVPDDFLGVGRRLREISVALAYTPYVRSTRINYKSSRISFKLVAADDLQHVSKMFDKATKKDEYENIPELGSRTHGGKVRDRGTVQADTWHFQQFNSNAKLKNNRLFVVVTRNDYPWGEVHSATEEEYSLVVCFRDREGENVRLYTQLRNQLQARMRVRAN